MAAELLEVLLLFLIGLAVSSIIIFAVSKLFGEQEGLGTAFVAALVGTIIYIVAFAVIGQGFYASIFAGVVWLLALASLYNMGWLKSAVIALLVWIAAAFVGVIVPTLVGPL